MATEYATQVLDAHHAATRRILGRERILRTYAAIAHRREAWTSALTVMQRLDDELAAPATFLMLLPTIRGRRQDRAFKTPGFKTALGSPCPVDGRVGRRYDGPRCGKRSIVVSSTMR